MSLQEVLDDNYEAFIAEGVTVLEFYAIWAGDCYIVQREIEQLAAEFTGQAKFGRVDIDICSWSLEQAEVTQLPNVVYYKNGQIVDRVLDVNPDHIYAEVLQKHL